MRAGKNIQEWIENMFDGERNGCNIQIENVIGTEQEFNSSVYGLKGKIDATVSLTSNINKS